jgi:hypothetical protein
MLKPIRVPQPNEQGVLEELQMDLVGLEGLPRFESLLRRHHYLVGRSSAWASGSTTWPRGVERVPGLVGVLCGGQASAGPRTMDWLDGRTARKRLTLVTNNARCLILPRWRLPNLATKVMGLCLRRLPQDWQARCGHEVWVGESFVDT